MQGLELEPEISRGAKRLSRDPRGRDVLAAKTVAHGARQRSIDEAAPIAGRAEETIHLAETPGPAFLQVHHEEREERVGPGDTIADRAVAPLGHEQMTPRETPIAEQAPGIADAAIGIGHGVLIAPSTGQSARFAIMRQRGVEIAGHAKKPAQRHPGEDLGLGVRRQREGCDEIAARLLEIAKKATGAAATIEAEGHAFAIIRSAIDDHGPVEEPDRGAIRAKPPLGHGRSGQGVGARDRRSRPGARGGVVPGGHGETPGQPGGMAAIEKRR